MPAIGDKPRDDGSHHGFLAWFIRQEAILGNRLEQLRKEEQSLRAYDATRARLRWDEDRVLDAEELGARLSRRPESIRARLARSRHGTLWLIDRWKALGALLDRGSTWNDDQKTMAFDLLGVSPTLRSGDPWNALGQPTPRALVDQEIQALSASLAKTLDALDTIERERAEEGRPVDPSPAMKRLRREESDCWRRLTRVQKLIERETAAGRDISQSSSAPAPATKPRPAPPTLPPPSPSTPVALVERRPLAPALSTPTPPPATTGNRRARRAALKLQRHLSR